LFDVAIVGGGLVGASLAVALRCTGLRIALIEAHAPDSAAQPSFDERTTALGNASRRVFEALGLWQGRAPAAAPIRAFMSGCRAFRLRLPRRARTRIDALGLSPNRDRSRIWRRCRRIRK
jgi:2-polyprenyl-6-methoxyphenol hydroxylase-like FAD-dependent oxidoreductase